MHTSLVLLLVPGRIGSHILRLCLVSCTAAAAEHLFEELELGGRSKSEE